MDLPSGALRAGHDPSLMPTILITGGSGLVGRRLTRLLLKEGFAVRHLSRSVKPGAAVPTFAWDIAKSHVDPRALEGVDHIVHLSGAGIADKPWTKERLRELYSSRFGAADVLRKAVEASGHWPTSFISASGINFYGTVTRDQVFTETDAAATDAIGTLTKAWEEAADAWSPHCRVVKLRTPMVLAREGGALPKLARPARCGLAAPFGSGKQWMPWVRIDDLARAYLHALRQADMAGAYNVVAPGHATNQQFTRALAKALKRPAFLPPLPGLLLRVALGGRSSLLLQGSRASSTKLLGTGFRFAHPGLEAALQGLLA